MNTNPNHFVPPLSNGIRGDSPHWQPPRITEEQQQTALLHWIQSQLRQPESLIEEPEPEPPRRRRPKWAQSL